MLFWWWLCEFSWWRSTPNK